MVLDWTLVVVSGATVFELELETVVKVARTVVSSSVTWGFWVICPEVVLRTSVSSGRCVVWKRTGA